MNIGALSLAQTPPLSVPLRYFLTAPLFLALAAALLLVEGPGVFASRWMPALIAATHLVTLGFATMIMVGAMQQLLPVLAGSPLPRPRLAAGLIHIPLTAGTAALATGLYLSAQPWLWAAVALLGAACVFFLGACGAALTRARSAHATIGAMAAALAGFLVTAGFGLHLAAGHASPRFGIARQFTDLHLSWGLFGWLAVLVIGVAYQVVPMFQITPEYPRRMQSKLTTSLFLLLVLWSFAEGLRRQGWITEEWLAFIPEAGIAAGLAWFAGTTLLLQHRRRRRLPDVTVDYWRVGMVALLLALPVWLVRPLVPDWAPFLSLLAVVLVLVGFGISVMSGMLYKIVPFLVWLHLNNQLQATGRYQGQVPNMKQVIGERRARWQLRLHLAALVTVIGACLWPSELLRPAAALWVANALFLAFNLYGALHLYLRTLVR